MPDERSTSISPTVVPPATAQQPTAGDGVASRQPWIWPAVGEVLFAGSFVVGYGLLTSGGTPPKESVHQSGVMAPDQQTGHEEETALRSPLSAEAIFAKASPAVVRVEVRDRTFKLIGQGSGFLVSEDGLVATNQHVIQNAYSAHVTFPDGSKYAVEGVAVSLPSSDLALVKIQGRGFPVLKLAEDQLPSVGTKVYAIGNPLGLTNSLSDGLVSGHRQLDGDFTYVQTTAAISPGSSGGPLLSQAGQVVGVTTASIRGGQNLNLVVPVKMLKDAINGQGHLQTLAASAGGQPLKTDDAQRLDEVYVAIDKQDYRKALKLLALLQESQKGSAAYWFYFGFVQGMLGNHELAIDAWRTSIKIDPSDEVTFYNLGHSYQDMGRHQEAIAAYKSALVLKPNYVGALRNTGVAYAALGDFHRAITSFRSVVALEPDNASDYLAMGIACTLSNQSEEALGCFRTAVTLEPNNAAAYYWTSVELRRLRRYEEAIQACRSAIRLKPDHELTYINMGKCYFSLVNNQEATQAFQTAITLNPNNAEANLFLGNCYLKDTISQLSAGRRAESFSSERKAREHLQRAVALDPNGQTGKQAQKALDAISR